MTAIACVAVLMGLASPGSELDRDGDGLSDGREDTNHDGSWDLGETRADLADSDGDGLSDGLEVAIARSATVLLDPLDRDSDDDGLLDGDEDANHDGAFQPAGADGDPETLADNETRPDAADTDGDGLLDGIEVGLGWLEPNGDDGRVRGTELPDVVLDADPLTVSDPNRADSDGGGVADGDEDPNHDGRLDRYELDPSDQGDDVLYSVQLQGGGCGASGQSLSALFPLPLVLGLWRRNRRRPGDRRG